MLDNHLLDLFAELAHVVGDLAAIQDDVFGGVLHLFEDCWDVWSLFVVGLGAEEDPAEF